MNFRNHSRRKFGRTRPWFCLVEENSRSVAKRGARCIVGKIIRNTVRQSGIEMIDKTLLITGGTGSFGNAVLDRFLDTEIKEIRIFSRDEKKQDDMRERNTVAAGSNSL